MKAVADNELVFRPDLYVIAWFELPVFHMIFFHSHKGRICVGLAEAVPIPERYLLLLVLGETREEVLPNLIHRFL